MTDNSSGHDILKISLSVSTDELEKFCNKLIKRSRDISKTHDSLSTIEAFIAVFGKAAHGSNEYYAIEHIIKKASEETRQKLLEEKSIALINALKKQDIVVITKIYTPLSRSGFTQILEIASGQFNQGEIANLQLWSADWVSTMKKKAEQASGYPDALDFKKAGINIEEYHAICDVNNFLNTD